MSPARDSWSPLPVVLRAGRKCGLLQGPAMLAGRPGDPGAGHLFATTRGHGVVRPQTDGFNQVVGLGGP